MEDNKYASRKFLLAVVLCLNGIIALWFGRLPAAEFNTLQLGILAVYMTGNVAQKFTTDSSKT